MNKEIRAAVTPAETRETGDGMVMVAGYAAVFNARANIGGWFTESIEPGAFADAINEDDVRFLINHTGLPLARTKSGTLKLSEDDHGLRMETELNPNDPDVQSIVPKMERNDLNEMSFAFRTEVEEWDESGDIPHRTIKKARLLDVAIVTYPAYDETEIGLRCLQEHREAQKPDVEVRRTRLRMKRALIGR